MGRHNIAQVPLYIRFPRDLRANRAESVGSVPARDDGCSNLEFRAQGRNYKFGLEEEVKESKTVRPGVLFDNPGVEHNSLVKFGCRDESYLILNWKDEAVRQQNDDEQRQNYLCNGDHHHQTRTGNFQAVLTFVSQTTKKVSIEPANSFCLHDSHSLKRIAHD